MVCVQFDSVLNVFLHRGRGYALDDLGRGVRAWASAVLSGLWLLASGHGSPMLAAALPLSALAALAFSRLPADYAVRPCAAASS